MLKHNSPIKWGFSPPYLSGIPGSKPGKVRTLQVRLGDKQSKQEGKNNRSSSLCRGNFLLWGRPELRQGRNLKLSKYWSLVIDWVLNTVDGFLLLLLLRVTGKAMTCSGGFFQE